MMEIILGFIVLMRMRDFHFELGVGQIGVFTYKVHLVRCL